MDLGDGKLMTNVDGDRLSSLPNDLIYKIYSFMDIRDAIKAAVLSSRWRFIWTSMPYLNFLTEDLSTLPNFSKFVTNVLSRRNSLTEVYSMKLNLRVEGSHVLAKHIMSYALAHNIQELNVVCLLDKHVDFPRSLFNSQSLKHLSLTTNSTHTSYRSRFNCYFITPTSTWELPTLTTLDLHSVTLCDDNDDKCTGVFSKCVNLKNLILKRFSVGSSGFSIVHPQLSNLTLENSRHRVNIVNVTAPQLKSLTIKLCSAKHVKIFAPGLASLFYKDDRPFNLSTEGFHSLEKADICVYVPQDAHAHIILCLLQQLHSVKFLKLNLETVEILSSSVDVILHQPSPFVNLKSLKIYPNREYMYNQEPKKVAMSTELKSYLLDSSPRATFTMVLREEIQAQKLIAELQVLLKKEIDNIKSSEANLEREKTPVESHEPKKLEIGGSIAQIKSSLENLVKQIQQRKENACIIISKLQHVVELVTSLPASNRAKIQPCLSSLCAEADTVISKINDSMKFQCDENQSRSRVCFDEIATKLEPGHFLADCSKFFDDAKSSSQHPNLR